MLIGLMSGWGHSRRIGRALSTSGLPRQRTSPQAVGMSQTCHNRKSTYSITASARPSNARDGAAAQLLRKSSVVLDARGTPDDFINLGGVISWIKSLSASVSNGLRSIPKFGGAAFAASLYPVVRAMGKLGYRDRISLASPTPSSARTAQNARMPPRQC